MQQPYTPWKSPATIAALAAGLFSLATISRHASPGDSATAIAQHAGLSPFLPVMHPLWSLAAHACARLPVDLAWSLNLFAAACTTLAAALFAHLVARLPHAPAEHPDGSRLARFAGTVAGLALVALPPVGILSSRAHPASLELLLLVAWLAVVQRHALTGRTRWLWFAAFAAGPAMVEITAAPAVVALMGGLAIASVFRHGARPWRTLTAAALLAAASVALTLAVWAWSYAHAPGNAWRDDLSPATALQALAQRQWLATRIHVFGFGWLFTLLMTAVPLLLAAILVRQPLDRPAPYGRGALCIALALPPVLLLWDAPMAPWRIFGSQSLWVLPLLFVAATFAEILCLASLWFRPLRWPLARWRAVATPVGVALCAAVLAGTCARQWPARNARHANVVAAWADATVRGLDSRAWLLSDGIMDDSLRLAARAAGRSVTVLDLSRSRQRAYLPYLASCFPEPRLNMLARVGLVPVLREWIATDPTIADHLAILPQPDLWLAAGFAAIPRDSLYLGTRQLSAVDANALARSAQAQDAAFTPQLRQLAERGNPDAARSAQHLLALRSRHATNLGLALENLDAPTLAADAYRRALAIDPGNLPALLNLNQLMLATATNAFIPDDDILAALIAQHREVPIPALIGRYGHIRTPEALELLRAARAPTPPPPEIALALAQVLAGETNAARTTLTRLIDAHPTQDLARVMLGLIAYGQNDTATVHQCIAELRARDKAAVPLLIVEGRLALRNDDTARARECFARVLALTPGNLAALEELMAIELDEPANDGASPLVQQVLSLDPGNALANFALGLGFHRAGKNDLAETAFRRSLERRPMPETYNNLAWLRHLDGDLPAALALVDESLRLEHHDAATWDTRGVILMRLNRLDEAADALARAKKLDPTAPEIDSHLQDLQRLR